MQQLPARSSLEETRRKRLRFANLANDELTERYARFSQRYPSAAIREAERTLRNYLTETGATDIMFENFTTEKLAETLSAFYSDPRTTDGQTFKITSLENFRNGINRFLQGDPHNRKIDIIKDSEFGGANEAFRTAWKELKLNQRSMISEADLKKLYHNLNTDTPYQLQAKVQFDVCFYIFRLCAERLVDMEKNTFVIKKDPNTGLRYVTKRQVKESKREENEQFSGFMPECPGDPKCPVASFEKLLNLLHPECDSLWQRPREFVYSEDPVWFYNQSCGRGTASTFMTRLSNIHNLSRIYSNHSILATGVSILSRVQEVPSLAINQRDLETEKLHMGLALNAALGTVNRDGVPAPVRKPTGPTAVAAGAVEVCAISSSSYLGPIARTVLPVFWTGSFLKTSCLDRQKIL